MLDLIDRRIAMVLSRVRTLARGVVSRVQVQAERVILQIDGFTDETIRDAELLQHYGFASVPKIGSEAVVCFLGSAPGAKAVIATHDRRYRLQAMEEGEVALFTDEGDVVHLQRGGIVVQSAGTVKVEASGTCTVEGSTVLLGEGAVESAMLGESFLAAFMGHTHESAAVGTPTTGPLSAMVGVLSSKVKVGG